MTKEEMSNYFELYTDVWRFFKKWGPSGLTAANADQCMEEANALSKKHNDSELIIALMINTVDELERIEKRR